MSDPANPGTQPRYHFLPHQTRKTIAKATLAALGMLIVVPLIQTIPLRFEYYAQQHKNGTHGANKNASPASLPTQALSITEQDIFTDEDEARKTLLTLFGGIVVVFGSIVGYLNFLNADKSIRLVEKKNADDAALAERKLNTDRYATAVGMLSSPGDEHMATRLGGIYLLESLAKDSEEFHAPVMDVLAAYVRINRPARDDKGIILEYTDYKPDVTAVLKVICRRDPHRDKNMKIDLSNINLDDATLAGAKLPNVIMNQVVARRIILDNADLSHANLVLADLTGAYARNANFSDAILVSSVLKFVNFYNTNLRKSILVDANLSRANLNSAKLISCNVDGTNFERAVLVNCDASGTHLDYAANLTAIQVSNTIGIASNVLDNLPEKTN